MKLNEFHVRDAATGAPAHGDAVARGDIGIRRIKINLPRAAGGEHRIRRGDGQHFIGDFIQHVGAITTLFVAAQAFAGNEIDGDVMFEQRDIRLPLHLLRERELHRMAGGILDMQNAPMAVAALARKVKTEWAGFVARERHAARHQPFDRVLGMFDDKARRRGIVQTGAGDDGVFDVIVGGIVVGDRRGNTALRPIAGAVDELLFGNQRDAFAAFGQAQRDGHTGQTAADDDDIKTLHRNSLYRMKL